MPVPRTVVDNYVVQVGWANTAIHGLGAFTARSPTTVYDDISADVKSIDFRRGRQTPEDTVSAGLATIKLNDTTGKYLATNGTSPLAGFLLPFKTVYIYAVVSGTSYPLFFGFIRSIDPDPLNYEATIQCIDGFNFLQTSQPVLTNLGATNTGSAIGRLVNYAGGFETNLANGDTIPVFSNDGSATALAKINDLLYTALGLFFFTGSGVATYLDRYAFNKPPRAVAQSTIVNTAQTVAPSISADTIKNSARVLKTGGIEQDYIDSTSRNIYGQRDFGLLTSDYLNSNNQAASLAQYLVLQKKDPLALARTCNLNNGYNLMDIISREVGDHVHIQDDRAYINGDFDIVGMSQSITQGGGLHTATWVLALRNAQGLPLVFGTSTFGSNHKFTY